MFHMFLHSQIYICYQYVNCNKRIYGEISSWVVQTARARLPRVALTHPSRRGSRKSGSLAITHLRRLAHLALTPCRYNRELCSVRRGSSSDGDKEKRRDRLDLQRRVSRHVGTIERF